MRDLRLLHRIVWNVGVGPVTGLLFSRKVVRLRLNLLFSVLDLVLRRNAMLTCDNTFAEERNVNM